MRKVSRRTDSAGVPEDSIFELTSDQFCVIVLVVNGENILPTNDAAQNWEETCVTLSTGECNLDYCDEVTVVVGENGETVDRCMPKEL